MRFSRNRVIAIILASPVVACSLVAGLDKDYVKVDCLTNCGDGGDGRDGAIPVDSTVVDAFVATDTSPPSDGSCGFDFDAATLEGNPDFARTVMPNSASADDFRQSILPVAGQLDQLFDDQTKLTWRKRPSDVPYTLAEGVVYCSGLPGGPWRVPTRLELLTIQYWRDFTLTTARPPPCLPNDTFAEDDAGAHYSLSSTPFADPDSGIDGWAVSTNYCGPVPTVVSTPQYIRCVKGDPPKPKFNLSKCGIVGDVNSGLEWQRTFQSNKAYKTAGGAMSASEYCNGLVLGPADDNRGWRVPTQQELYSIIDTRRLSPAVNLDLFKSVPASGRLLSSTKYDSDLDGGLIVSGLFLEDGQQDSFTDTQVGVLTCVRKTVKK